MEETPDWLTGLAFVLGLWILVSPFVFGASGTLLWNGIVAGVLVAALTAYEYARDEAAKRTWSAWIVTVLGLWTVASPFVLSAGPALRWSNVVAGIAVAVLAGYTGYSASGRPGRSVPGA